MRQSNLWEWAEARHICVQVARRYTADPGEVEDIAHEALLRAWRRRASLRSADRLREWLAAIVRNEAFRHSSKRRSEPVPTIAIEAACEDRRVVSAPERADLHVAIEGLEKADQLLLWLRYGEDLTQTSIAGLLEIPEGTVKVRLHRVREKLRRALERP